MPRQVIVGILVMLIIGILGGTAVVVISRLRVAGEDGTSQTSPLPIVGSAEDSDGDGLPDALEALWGTDPNNPDSDGDGFPDGQEVEARHNPTIPGPNDALPPGFQLPSINNKSQLTSVGLGELDLSDLLDPAAANPAINSSGQLNPALYVQQGLPAQQFQQLTGPNLTSVYQAQGGDGSPESIAEFVRNQPIITSLPEISLPQVRAAVLQARQPEPEQPEEVPFDGRDRQGDLTKPLILREYVSFLSGTLRAFNQEVSQGILDNLLKLDSTRLVEIAIGDLQQQRAFVALSEDIPEEGQNVHQVTLAYMEAQLETLKRVAKYEEDKVGALVALRQLDALDRQYHPLIIAELNRLEKVSYTL
jgi:hypothetical protein